MPQFDIGTVVMGYKHLVNSPVYRDWRPWAIGPHGWVAFNDAVKKVMNKKVYAHWYNSKDDPYDLVFTDTPDMERHVTFCGSITGSGIYYDINKEIGHVKLYVTSSESEADEMRAKMADVIKQLNELLAD